MRSSEPIDQLASTALLCPLPGGISADAGPLSLPILIRLGWVSLGSREFRGSTLTKIMLMTPPC